MSTSHIAGEKGDFGKVVLMPGDPKRATYIAENFLKNVTLVSDVRGTLAYTGYTESGKRISVMSSGMGMPTMGLYAYELFSKFGVELIIRVGTCGSYQENIKIKDILVASSASTDSNWAYQYELPGTFSANADFVAANVAYTNGVKMGLPVKAGNILSSDIFYDTNKSNWKKWAAMGVLAVEMESYSLYCTAARLRKKALSLLTVADSFITNEHLSRDERETACNDMIKIALVTAEKYA